MEAVLLDYIDRLADPFLNPQKRVFAGYLFFALGLALAVGWITRRTTLPSLLREFFAVRVWWSKSARADYKILIINQAVMMGVGPRLLTKLGVATVLFETMHLWLDGRVVLWPQAPGWMVAVMFTSMLFVLDDAAKYWLHRALHRFPLLWCFHKVHHTAETLTPLTVYRTHPVEGVLFALRAALVQGVAVGAFVFFFGDRAEFVTVLGANVFLFLFNAAGSNLRHSHVWISYGPAVEKILISPAQHQIHHSTASAEGNSNYGSVLAIWDWMGGSLIQAKEARPARFGLCDNNASSHDLKTVYLTPLVEAARTLSWPIRTGSFGMSAKLRKVNVRRSAAGATAVLVCVCAWLTSAVAAELNIYSHRQPFLINPFIEAYKAKTGTEINIVYASKGLAQRLQAEGSRSPADIVLTVDIARLNVYADKGLLAPVISDVLQKNIPAHLRAPDNTWFAFSKRARVIAISKSVEDADDLKRYEDLADPKWRGRICTRPGSHVYNRALVASLINASGAEAAEAWAAALMENLARRPQGNDRAQVKAVYEGVCDIAIINNYYFGNLKRSEKPEQREWAAAVRLIFPNQEDRGTHINISGGGVAKHSKNKEEAIRFLEFLTSKAAQDLYGAVNYEYPVNPSVQVPPELRSWGSFIEDEMPIARIAELAPEAQKVIDRVGW